MHLFDVIVLALIQGLTEFLPVSSSGHLILIPKLFKLQNFGLAFDAFLHLGTLFAVLIYFRKDVINLFKGFFGLDKKYTKLAWAIFFATLPVIVTGFAFKDFFESSLVRSVDAVAYTLIAGSVLLFIADRFFVNKKDIANLGFSQIIFIGLIQCLALFPGMSRSGSTIAAGIFTGLKKDEAARFSFLLGLPAIAGAGVLALKDMFEAGSFELSFLELALGLFFSFLSGYLAIDFLLKFLKTQSLFIFVIYRILMALALLFAL